MTRLKRLLKTALLILVSSGLSGTGIYPTQADLLQKHPRAAELEDKLTRDAGTYLKGRFPEKPFLVTVSIDPLFRVERSETSSKRGSKKSEPSEDLPLMDSLLDENLDEWDDPKQTLFDLLLRVKKVSVQISIPQSVRDDEADEIKNSIFALLHLSPARDEIKIERRNWDRQPIPYTLGLLGLFGILTLLGGLFFINRMSAKRLGQVLSTIRASNSGNSNSATSAAPVLPLAREPESSKSKIGGESISLQTLDTVQVTEIATKMIEGLASQKSFPNLRQMIALDEIGKSNPSLLGAILGVMPASMRNNCLSLSSQLYWLQSVQQAGRIDSQCIDVIQNLLRLVDLDAKPELEQLAIYAWRLNDEVTLFFRNSDVEVGMTILRRFPKALAIRLARECFPGKWAILIEKSQSTPIPANTIETLSEMALNLRPLTTPNQVKQYVEEIEIIDWLNTANIEEERELYNSLNKNSFIHRIRKPFFKAFEESPEIIGESVASIPFNELIIALFDIPKRERIKFETHFNDKQKMFFSQAMRQLDQKNPTTEQIIKARKTVKEIIEAIKKNQEKIAQIRQKEEELSANQQKKQEESIESSGESSEESNDEAA